MTSNLFTEGVKPGGLTTDTEIGILICYLLDTLDTPIPRSHIDEVLLGEELVNYFALAECLSNLKKQGLISGNDDAYCITDSGRSVGRTLAQDLPRTVRDAAARGVIRAQQFAANSAANHSEIIQNKDGRFVRCSISDSTGSLFQMDLYMPDTLSAQAVQKKFIENGDEVYKLVLAALTDNRQLAEKALEQIK